MSKLSLFLIFYLTLFCHSSLANDSSWGEVNGTITLLKQNDISMAKERLLIAADRINVDYLFVNHGKQDVTLPITFPMPSIYQYAGQDLSPGVMNFKLSVNGKPIKTATRWVIMRFDKNDKNVEDITAKVIQSGWTIQQLIHSLKNDEALYNREKNALPPLPDEWFDSDGNPMFYAQQHFTWQQTFPAGKEVMINHSYTPSLSGGVPTDIQYIVGDGTKENPPEECLNNTTHKQVEALDKAIKTQHQDDMQKDDDGKVMSQIGWNNLSYILSTGANWKDGVINDFTLRIHKSSPEEVVVTCFKQPLKQISPLTLEYTQKDFKPDEDIHLQFYYDPFRE